jgi:hypothetical protein
MNAVALEAAQGLLLLLDHFGKVLLSKEGRLGLDFCVGEIGAHVSWRNSSRNITTPFVFTYIVVGGKIVDSVSEILKKNTK